MCDTPIKGTAIATEFIDNNRVRVTEWRFAQRGDNTGWHRHEYDYVIVPITTGQLKIIDAQGEANFSQLESGVSYFRNAGVEHDVINANDHEFSFVEVEFK